MRPATPAQAYWNQRDAFKAARPRLQALAKGVNSAGDLSTFQWAQLFSFAMEFAPNLIVELGRGYGNSTCVFAEAANRLPDCRVLSLCNTEFWDRDVQPRLKKVVPASWFAPLDARYGDILAFDFEKALLGRERVLVFWDAHGFAVAECVLGDILPRLAARPHVVAMHDLSDARYFPPGVDDYGADELWTGDGKGWLRIGNIKSTVAQAIAITDFCTRNRLTLDSADHSFHSELSPEQLAELRATLGDEYCSVEGHWFWFSLNEKPGPYTFPRYVRRAGA
jgi:hypothetical protein